MTSVENTFFSLFHSCAPSTEGVVSGLLLLWKHTSSDSHAAHVGVHVLDGEGKKVEEDSMIERELRKQPLKHPQPGFGGSVRRRDV